MPAELPVPIEFRLPEGWLPAKPNEVDAEGVAFAAVHPVRMPGSPPASPSTAVS